MIIQKIWRPLTHWWTFLQCKGSWAWQYGATKWCRLCVWPQDSLMKFVTLFILHYWYRNTIESPSWMGRYHLETSIEALPHPTDPHTREKCVQIHRRKHWAITTSMDPSEMCHTLNINSKVHYLALVQQSFWYALPTGSHLSCIVTRLVPSTTAACSDLYHWESLQSQP